MKKKFDNIKDVKDAFIEYGWGDNITFSEITLEDAKRNQYLDIAYDICINGIKFFKMNETGYVYNDNLDIVKSSK